MMVQGIVPGMQFIHKILESYFILFGEEHVEKASKNFPGPR